MSNWLDSVLAGVSRVQVGGVPQPSEATLDLEASNNVTLTPFDDPQSGALRVYVSAGTSVTLLISTSTALTAAQLSQPISAPTNAGAITLTLPNDTTGLVDGAVLRVFDPYVSGTTGGSWSVANALTLAATGGWKLQDPNNPGAYTVANGSVSLTQGGASVLYMAILAMKTWIRL